MKLNTLDTSVYSACAIIILIFATISLAGCETWRGMGKDTRNVTEKTANTMNNVFGGNQKKHY